MRCFLSLLLASVSFACVFRIGIQVSRARAGWPAVSLLWVTSLSAHAETPQQVAELLGLQGDRAVAITRFVGSESRELGATVGMKLFAWDKLRTSPGAAARIRYLDGSTALVGRDTELELQPKQEGAQFNRLSFGQMRAQVVPDPNASKAGAKNERPRFLVRTRTAVMGVRGTDFVAGVDPMTGGAQLHTIEGVVDIGASEQSLFSGQALSVPAGSGVDFSENAPPRIQNFARPAYSRELAQAQPELSVLPERGAQPPDGILPSERSEYQKAKEREPTPEAGRGRFQFKQFSAGAVGLLQVANSNHSGSTGVSGDGSGKLVSFELAYLPSIRILGPVWIRGLVSAMPLKEVSAGGYFLGTQLGLLLALDLLDPLWIEAGAGIEKWPGSDSPTGVFARAQLGWVLSETSFLERIYLGASIFDSSNSFHDPVFAAHAGLGFRL